MARYESIDTVEQSKMLPGGSNYDKLTDVGTTSFVPTSVSLSSFCLRESVSYSTVPPHS